MDLFLLIAEEPIAHNSYPADIIRALSPGNFLIERRDAKLIVEVLPFPFRPKISLLPTPVLLLELRD